MNLAVSNIAWAACDRTAAYDVLRSNEVRGLEIAPGLFFHQSADPFVPTTIEVATALEEAEGLELVSMQSLLFGVEGAALFGAPHERDMFRSGMLRAIALAGRLSIPNLVFGSPRQRVVPDTMSELQAQEVALQMFADLGDSALRSGTKLGLEFNPAAYGTNFLNTLEQADAFVACLGHPAVTIIMDLGAMHMNGAFAEISRSVASVVSPISHVHISEPHLAPAPAQVGEAAAALSALDRRGYANWVSIEMKPSSGPVAPMLETSLSRLKRAVEIANEKADLA